MNRRSALVALVLVSLACAPVSWIDEGVTPSWVVCPLALLVGLYGLSEGGATGTLFVAIAALVFLLVHLPWTYAALFGDENPLNADREFSPVQWLITLFAIPLATAIVASLARREAQTRGAAGSLR